MDTFSTSTRVSDALAAHPEAAAVMAAHGLSGCYECGSSAFETLGQVCTAYGVKEAQLLLALNALTSGTPDARAN